MPEDIHISASIGDLQWLKQSASSVGDINSYDNTGLAPVHLATIHGKLDCLKFLIEECGVSVEFPTINEWRPIHLCLNSELKNKSKLILMYLLQMNSEINVKNKDGITPMHQAASEGLVECLEILIAKGARIDVYDNFGNLPIDLAKLWGHIPCIKRLKNKMWHLKKSAFARKSFEEKEKSIFKLLQNQSLESCKNNKNRYFGSQDFYEWLINLKITQKSRICQPQIGSNIQVNNIRSKDKSQKMNHFPNSKLIRKPATSSNYSFSTALHEEQFFGPKIPNLRDLHPRDPYTLEISPQSTPLEINPFYEYLQKRNNYNITKFDTNINHYIMNGKMSQRLMNDKHNKDPFRKMYYRRKTLDESPSYTVPAARDSWTIKQLQLRKCAIGATMCPGDTTAVLYKLACIDEY